jgi:cytochrome o ubiquinol oxidase operon protein cyoD
MNDFSANPHDEHDVAPGAATAERQSPRAAVAGYAIGLVLSALLTLASFYLLHAGLVWQPAIPVALVVLAAAQMGVQLVFFLHITTAADNTNNVLALAFGVLIVTLIIVGSLWIMAHLNRNMMPMGEPAATSANSASARRASSPSPAP